MGAENSKNTHWQKDSESATCQNCRVLFSVSVRRHHCRNCGLIFCNNCSKYSSIIPARRINTPVRVCAGCFNALRRCNCNSAALRGTNCSNWLSQADGAGNTRSGCETNDALYGVETGNLLDDTVVDENGYSMKFNSLDTGMGDGFAETVAISDSYARFAESCSSAQILGEQTAGQSEKERLAHLWSNVRQQAVFIDILLQQVERVESDTEVMYCMEVDNISLQPETPELLKTMFSFPQPASSNVEILLEAFDTRLHLPVEESKRIDNVLKQLLTQLSK